MEAYLDWQKKSAGIKLNDVIEEFKYVYKGQTVKAGDFVNYINGVAGKTDYGESVDTQLSTESHEGTSISAVALDENKVFVVHLYGSNYHLYGVVVRVNGASIVVGEPTVLSTSSYAGYQISTCLLPNGNVFIAHSFDTNRYLYGMIVSIDGTTISIRSDTALNNSTAQTGTTISTCLLPNGNIFIAHSYGTSYYLYGMVISIDGDTITKGSDTSLVTSDRAGGNISTCLLPNGNVFIAHGYNTNPSLYAIVCKVNGTTITKGADTTINSTSYTGNVISTCVLPNGNVFIAHCYSSSWYLYGIVCSISDTTITKGTDTKLGDTSYSGLGISAVLLSNGNVFIAHSYGSSYHLYGMVVSIDSTNLTKLTDTELNSISSNAGRYVDSLLLDNGTIFTAHSYGSDYHLYAQIFGIDYENNIPTNNIVTTEYEQQVTPAIEPPFNAVALSSGVGAPEFVEGEVKKTEDIIPKEWTKVSDLEYTANGVILTASSVDTDIYYACDNDADNTAYTSTSSSTKRYEHIQWEFDEAKKITKMFLKIYSPNYLTTDYDSITIQGSNDNSSWTDLFSIPLANANLYNQEVELSNTDYYKQYRIYAYMKQNALQVYGWYVTEYTAIEQIPSTEHNEQVKIARLPMKFIKTDNIFNQDWVEVQAGISYSASNGMTLTATSTSEDNDGGYIPTNACDGNEDTYWLPNQSGTARQKLEISFPIGTKITKMSLTANTESSTPDIWGINIYGVKNDGRQVLLYDVYSTYGEEPNKASLILNNPDYYISYILENYGNAQYGQDVSEWQVLEYEVTEVIQ